MNKSILLYRYEHTIIDCGDARGVMFTIVITMDIATRVQIQDESVYISHSANTLGKGKNPTILPLALSRIVGQTGFFSLGMVTSLEEGKL